MQCDVIHNLTQLRSALMYKTQYTIEKLIAAHHDVDQYNADSHVSVLNERNMIYAKRSTLRCAAYGA